MGNSHPCCGQVVNGDEESGWLFSILECCDPETRSSCLFLTKRYCKVLTSDASFRWRLDRLHVERGLYYIDELPAAGWRSLFLDLHKKRHLWDVSSSTEEEAPEHEHNKCSIAVFARFKPLDANCNPSQKGRKSVLPLHQRLALIRIDKRLDSNKDALGVLKEQGGWFQDRCWDGLELEKDPEMDSAHELDRPELTSGIKMIDSANARVVICDPTKGLREILYDGVLRDDASQRSVYDTTTRGLVCDVINGVSATCLVYGQTGSGKTYTMFGDADSSCSSFAGIVPRACSELMQAISYRKGALNLNMDCSVAVSFVEVYGNDILDLPAMRPEQSFGTPPSPGRQR